MGRASRSMASHCIIAYVTIFSLLQCTMVYPQSHSGKFRMDFSEEQEPGTVVARLVQMFSVRTDDLPGRNFQILGQRMIAGHELLSSEGKWLDIDTSTGVITVKQPVDRETECGDDSELECVILLQTVMMPQPHFRLQDFELVVTDVNDHAPKFPSTGMDRIFSLHVSEDNSETTKISLDQFLATDEDIGENALIYYSISRNEHFGLNQYKDDTGASHLELVVLSKLDYEDIDTFDLTLTAKDRGSPASRSSQVFLRINVIDANDNVPKFEESVYNLELRENLPAGHSITTVVARDADTGRFGQIRYFVPEAGNSVTARRLITVDPVSGTVKLLKPLDREIKKNLRVVIAAKDLATAAEGGSQTGKTVLLIHIMDVNDNAPRIHVNVILKGPGKAAYVEEDADLGTYVAHVSANDADNGESGAVTLMITTFLDNSDPASPSSADSIRTGRNAGNVEDYFRLNSDNLIATNSKLNREEHDKYSIKITACDHGNPPRCSHKNLSVVVLDSNDHWPEFKTRQHYLTLSESTQIGSFITTVTAYDKDARNTPALTKTKDGKFINSQNGEVRYSLMGGGAIFAIESKTGKLTLVGKLDYERSRSWSLTIVAQDLGETEHKNNFTLNVKVTDVNDNKPEFANPGVSNMTVYATILEDRAIIRIKAVDRDAGNNAEVWYSISSEDGAKKSQKFLIDPVTGNLRLNRSNTLTELLGEHHLTIKAKDKGQPSLESETRLIVKVTDLPLASIIPNYQEPSNHESSKITVIVLASLASATVILLLILACIVIKCKRENKEIRTYNCRAAESNSGRNLACPSKSNMSNIGSIDEVVIVSTPGITTTKEANFGRAMEINRSRSMTLRNSKSSGTLPPSSKYATIDKGPSFTTFRHSNNHLNNVSNNQITSPHTDGDSGKGESDKDSDSNGDHQQAQTPSERNFLQYCSRYLNELGPRCTTTCREYGHSDECWMPVVAHCDIHGEHDSFVYSDSGGELDESGRTNRPYPEQLLPSVDPIPGRYGNFDNCGLETISETQPLRIVLDTAEQSSMYSCESYSQHEYPTYPATAGLSYPASRYRTSDNGMYSPTYIASQSHAQSLLQEHHDWRDAFRPQQMNEYNNPSQPAMSSNIPRSSVSPIPVSSLPYTSAEMIQQYSNATTSPQSVCEANTPASEVLATGSVMDKVKLFSQGPVRRGSLRDQVLQTRFLNSSLTDDSSNLRKEYKNNTTSTENWDETDASLEETRKILSDIDNVIS